MKKILIVDDSIMDRKLLMGLLKKSGIDNEILQAVDGEAAVQILGENYKDICLVLLDWQMPKMTGIEFMKAVRRVPEVMHIPIIMITASGSDDSKKEAREANPDLANYIVKPYRSDMLIEAIKTYLQ